MRVHESIAQDKTAIRRAYAAKRTALTDDVRVEKDRQISNHFVRWMLDSVKNKQLEGSERQRTIKTIALYSAFRGEVDLCGVLPELWRSGYMVAFPRVNKKTSMLTFHSITEMTDLEPGNYGILEPNLSCEELPTQVLDVVLVPGLSFTPAGIRLGYGGGFYDRVFANQAVTAVRVGVLYQLQTAHQLPCEAHDVRMQYLLTEHGVHPCDM